MVTKWVKGKDDLIEHEKLEHYKCRPKFITAKKYFAIKRIFKHFLKEKYLAKQSLIFILMHKIF